VREADRDKRVEELFQLAIELRRSEREGFFRRHCGDDAELRAELEALLVQDDEGTKDFLTSPVLDGEGPPTKIDGAEPTVATALPERIGRYRLIERIGEGGMGAVFLAEQESPLRREVALKVVKLGMDTEKVLARFERERQALALMDHPGIARIFDGGTTEMGRPYFVMEYVKGQAVHEFCRRHGLSVRERLSLFARVCEAVQHAHQKGIIHRDIKPTNVLVTERDGHPEPKIIDFGIARAVTRTEEETKQTRPTEVVGTSHYMSPEQADLAGANVDTRTDIYSLGVLLYELLTGVLPFDRDTLRKKSPAEIQSFLRHTDPLPPSTRLVRLEDPTTVIASSQIKDVRTLARRLSGDLDWITLKAMAREPERRYATASELAAEIERYLNDEPVFAGPPDWTYKVSKFVRRHRVGVMAGSLAVLSLIGGVIGTTWGMVAADHQAEEAKLSAKIADESADAAKASADEARAAEQRAEEERHSADEARHSAEEEREKADDARRTAEELRATAEVETRQARAVTEFLVEAISLADPEVALNPDTTLQDMLHRAGARVETTPFSPEGEATLRRAIGQAFHSLDEVKLAQEHLERALEIQDGLEDIEPEELYATTRRLSKVYEDSDSRNARDLGLRACRMATRIVRERYPEIGANLGRLLEEARRFDLGTLAERLHEIEGQLDEKLLDHEPLWLVVADAFQFMGYHLGYQYGETGSLPFLEASLRIRREQLPPKNPEIAKTSDALVKVLNQLGEHERALQLVIGSIAIYSAAYPQNHPWLLEARSLKGECLSLLGDFSEAERLLHDSYQALRETRGPESRASIDAAYRLVRHYEAERRPDEAERYREILAQGMAFGLNVTWRWDRRDAVFGPRHAELSEALEQLDRLTEELIEGKLLREIYLYRMRGVVDEIIRLRQAELPDDHPLSVIVARVLQEHTRRVMPDSPEIHRIMCDEILAVLGPHRARLTDPVAIVWKQISQLARHEGDPARAEDAVRAALEVEREVYSRCSPEAVETELLLVLCLHEQGRLEDAEPELVMTWQECIGTLGPGHTVSGRALRTLIGLYDVLEQPERAEEFLRVHLDGRRAKDTNAGRIDRYAWFAVRSDVFSEELYRLALATARRGVETAPENGSLWNTYAAALYRVERYDEVLDAIDRAMELGERTAPLDWPLRAMALHRLGRGPEAEAARERGRELVEDQRSPQVREARRLLAEADGVLSDA
jgi:serine/threonine protein kinase/gas vesicle protein